MLRSFQSAALAAATLMILGTASSCVTGTGEGGTTTRSRRAGSPTLVMDSGIEDAWSRVRGIVGRMTSDPLMNNGANRSFRTTIDGSETTVRLESRGSQSTAVHVDSKNPAVVQKIRSAIRR